MREINRTEEFLLWIADLDEDAKEAIFKNLSILKEFGPSLGRPLVDHIKGSKVKNLKELRVQNKNRVIRIFFAFDPKRNIILLLGGDKRGNPSFYQDMIKKVEKLYQIYLNTLEIEYDQKKYKKK
jgi:hypothetical protein